MTPLVARPENRQSQRRTRTRAKLVAAAGRLIAKQGVEATRINEITEEADVGFGSFYNYFDGKDAIVEAVLVEATAAQGAAIEALTAGLEDPAEVISAAHRHFVRLAAADPDWAWLLVRLDASQDIFIGALAPFARRDLQRAVAAGRVEVADPELAIFAAGGALLGVIRAVLDGEAPPDADEIHAEGVLRLLGLSAQDAAEVARRPAQVPAD